LKDGDKILDIGAGAGEYSLYFARKGYEVSALELADANIAAFKKKLTPEDKSILFKAMPLTSLDMQISRLILSFCSARFII
jgi:cyclopropane fatty-acyl-phospholipid synthase-like methyltransferase